MSARPSGWTRSESFGGLQKCPYTALTSTVDLQARWVLPGLLLSFVPSFPSFGDISASSLYRLVSAHYSLRSEEWPHSSDSRCAARVPASHSHAAEPHSGFAGSPTWILPRLLVLSDGGARAQGGPVSEGLATRWICSNAVASTRL